MATHAFRLLKQRDIEYCIRRTETALRSWAHDWQPGIQFSVLCNEASDPREQAPDGSWKAWRAARGPVWCYSMPELQPHICDVLFGLDEAQTRQLWTTESSIINAIAEEAATDLITRLLEQLVVSSFQIQEGEITPPSWHFRRHSGSAMISISLAGYMLYLLVPHEQFPRHDRSARSRQRSPVEPLVSVLGNVPVRLTAQLEEMEISLGHFLTIRPNDVLQWTTRLDHPIELCTSLPQPVALAHLGRQGEYRAIETLKTSHLSRNHP